MCAEGIADSMGILPGVALTGMVLSSGDDSHEHIDMLERAMIAAGSFVDLPLKHTFTPGLYTREIFMPAGSLVVSKIHATEHPYVVTRGKVSVFIPERGVEHIMAPHTGITKPHTRRVLFVHEDTTWITFHPISGDEQNDLAAIEARIIERREIELGLTAYELMTAKIASGGAPLLGQQSL